MSLQVEPPGGGGSSSPFLWNFLRGVPEIWANVLHQSPCPLQATENHFFSLSCRILRPCSPTLAPRCPNIARDSQENSILEPRSFEIPVKHLPRQAPGPSREGPKLEKKKAMKASSFLVHFSAISSKIVPRIKKNDQHAPQNSLKSAIFGQS